MPTATTLERPKKKLDDSKPKSVVIIGAGPGGLAAAMLMAKGGVQVTVLERLQKPGGRCSSITELGFKFDLGPTFFLYPRVLDRIYKAVGRNLWNDVPMTRLDPQYRVIFGERGGHLDCTPNLTEMAKRVSSIHPGDGANVERFIVENRVKLERFRPALENPFLKWTNLLSAELLKMLPLLRPWNSVDSELKRYFKDERTRLAFSFQAKYLGMSPFNCPSLFSILSYLEYDYGVWHPRGGCNAVSENMAEQAEQLGVDIRYGEHVTEILFEGKKAIGAKTASDEFRGEALVINADFANAMVKLVPNHLRKNWTDSALGKKRFSCSTFMMYLGMDGPAPDLPHHTIYTSEKYLDNLKDIEQKHTLSDDPSVYVQNAGINDDTLAPQGHHTLYVLSPVTHQHGNVNWATEAAAFRTKVLQRLSKLGIPDLEQRIRFEKIITPAGWQFDYEVFKGATFNLAHNLGQMLHLRPRNRFEDLKNVYLVGGGTHPGSGLPVIYESARITSRLLLNDFGLSSDFLEVDVATTPLAVK